MHLTRLLPTAVAVLATTLSPLALTGPAHAAPAAPAVPAVGAVAINEIESSGGTPGDWIELKNTGSTPVDVSHWVLRDNDDTHAVTLPLGTTIAAGGYYTSDVDQPSTPGAFGLGSADSARLYDATGTLQDTYSWTAHAATTYGRCPDGTGDFTTTASSTKNAENDCPGDVHAQTWPGGADIATADDAGFFGTNLSGLTYEAAAAPADDVLWGVKNGPSTMYELRQSGGVWRAVQTDGWAAGKALHYPDGTGDPDTEGIAYTGSGSAAGMYVSTERNNSANTVSRPEVLEFDPTTSATSLNATDEWNLTSDLPAGLPPNSGLEAISWVPDGYLTGHGFLDEHTGATYAPSSYPGHGSGLFFVGLEANGSVYAYALMPGGTYQRVATVTTGLPSVMDLEYEPETQRLWAECDDTCQGQTAILTVDQTAGSATLGRFVAGPYYARPAGMPNLNNEGFAITPQSRCVGGAKPVYWSDDTNDDSHALRSGTLGCTVAARTPQPVTFTSTPPSSPVVGQSYPVAATGGASGNPVVLAVDPASADVCSLSGSTVLIVHPGTCTIVATQAGDDQYDDGSGDQTATAAQAVTAVAPHVNATSLIASITVTSPGRGEPTGSVEFLVDGTSVGAAPVQPGSTGTATLDHVVPSGATHEIQARYSGDPDFTASTGDVERRDPTITAAVSSTTPPSSYGWYAAPVTVTFTCSADGSPLARECPSPETVSGDGADQSVTGTVVAQDGGAGTATVGGLDVDRTAPHVRITGITSDALYVGRAPTAACAGSDATSGVVSCTLATTRGGKHATVTAVATDRAGNRATTSVGYRFATRYLGGARYEDGVFEVKAGHQYALTALIAGSAEPTAYAVTKPGASKHGSPRPMTRRGTLESRHRWVRTVTISRGLGAGVHTFPIMDGGSVQRVRFRLAS